MSFFTLFPSYIMWHYTTGVNDLKNTCRNFFFFLSHFFSLKTLFGSLFAPWQRLGEDHFKGETIYEYMATFVVNIMMRFVGFFMRSILIIIGLTVYLVASLITVAIFIIWPFLPVIAVGLFVGGISNLFVK